MVVFVVGSAFCKRVVFIMLVKLWCDVVFVLVFCVCLDCPFSGLCPWCLYIDFVLLFLGVFVCIVRWCACIMCLVCSISVLCAYFASLYAVLRLVLCDNMYVHLCGCFVYAVVVLLCDF